jgi:hypothetical protein
VAVSIIESKSANPGHVMDTVWAIAAESLGYTHTIRPQTALDDTAFFSQTNILIISSGVIALPANRAKTILQFIRSGKPVYLQGEYLNTYSTNIFFDALVDSLGGAFTLGGTVSGDLSPMVVTGTLSTTPNPIASLAYFWYGCSGTGDTLTCIPFLSYQGNNFGFIFTPPNPTLGKVIMTTDQDWVRDHGTSAGLPLIENILAYLSNLTVTAIPTILSVSPDSAVQGQALPVTITGQNTSFRVSQGSSTSNASHVWFSQGSSTINASDVSVSSETELTANFSIPGDALTGLWDVHVEQPVGKGIVTLHDGFTINHGVPAIPTPHILFVRDVPNDNGKQVFVRWSVDTPAVKSGIARFGVWRKDSVWTFLKDSVLTVNDTVFQFVAPTIYDSTKVSGMRYSVFRVSAHNVNPAIFTMSPPDSGYSLDNLAPSVPKGLKGTIQVGGGTIAALLQWNKVPEKDLRYYAVYRSETAGFTQVDSTTFVGASADTTYRDTTIVNGKKYYYRVVAFDWSGNRSDPSDQLALTVTSVGREGIEIPKEFSIAQNYPNPFNPTTIIRYGVPAQSRVKIEVFNAIGQLVATLLDGEREAGYYDAEWRASVASGIYMYRIEAIAVNNPTNAFVQVKKMVLLR